MDALDSACVLFEPVLIALLATDPRWKDNIPFHEYFHGDPRAARSASATTTGVEK